MKKYFVYIITNADRHTVLYTGFTDNVERRVYEHKQKLLPGFSKKYNCDKLVYFDGFLSMGKALHREKQIKRYRREWNENLINSMNPQWNDLYELFLVN